MCVVSSLSSVYRIVPVVPDHVLQIDLTVHFCSVFHWLSFKIVKSHHIVQHALAAVCKRCGRRANGCASRRGNEGNTRIICFDGIQLVRAVGCVANCNVDYSWTVSTCMLSNECRPSPWGRVCPLQGSWQWCGVTTSTDEMNTEDISVSPIDAHEVCAYLVFWGFVSRIRNLASHTVILFVGGETYNLTRLISRLAYPNLRESKCSK